MRKRRDEGNHQDATRDEARDEQSPGDPKSRDDEASRPNEPQAANEVEEATIAATDPENAPG